MPKKKENANTRTDWKKIFENLYLIKDLYPECTKNSYISIIRQTIQSKNEQKT